MITLEDRKFLLDQMQNGDMRRAKEHYKKATGRSISISYLSMFIHGDKPVTGAIVGSHQPGDIYAAIAAAISERLDRQKKIETLVSRIKESTMQASRSATV